MGQWLDVDKLDGEGEASDPPDLFVVGFQEVLIIRILFCPTLFSIALVSTMRQSSVSRSRSLHLGLELAIAIRRRPGGANLKRTSSQFS